ncbi:hypothetical protein FCOIX_2653 [Fusarium coicis]|nr:hypothetical protein FCOIX_2653 [Fusarium coicis]
MNRSLTKSQRVVKPGAKRRRPPLACIQCYQRKLKCSREFPACSRCSKAGIADECTYRGNKGWETSVDGLFGDGLPGGANVVLASTRIEESSTETPDSYATSATKEGGMTHLEGQGNSTKFYGCSYPLNLYQQFTDLRPYIAKIKTHYPSINTLRDEIYAPFNDKQQRRQILQDVALEYTLRHMIPAKPTMDVLVQTYVDRYEITHRILHIPTFITKYNDYWADRSSTPVCFLVQLLLVAATGASCHPEVCIDVFSHNTTHDHVIKWVEAAEAWVSSQSNQPPRSWDILVIHCLLLLAKRANFIKEGSFWTSTGTLVRWAMAAGYHREVIPAAKISLFSREMRRRLWVTVIELDLQASIERGMPPNVRIGDFNIKSPLNVDDEQLEESMQESLVGMPIATLTNTSFQALLYRSLPARLKICAFINGCCEEVDFDKVLELEEELGQALQDIPAWDNPQADLRQHRTATYIKNMLVFPQISAFLIENVEKVLEILEKRISLTLNGLNEYYILSMALGLLKGRLWPESAAESDKEAGERVIKLCRLMQTRKAAIRHQPLVDVCDDGQLRGNQLSIDENYIGSDIMTDLINSTLPQDLEFIHGNFDLTFFHA